MGHRSLHETEDVPALPCACKSTDAGELPSELQLSWDACAHAASAAMTGSTAGAEPVLHVCMQHHEHLGLVYTPACNHPYCICEECSLGMCLLRSACNGL